MKRGIYLIITLALLSLCGCSKDIELGYNENIAIDNVEDLGDGRIRIRTSLEALGMTSVTSRADFNYEDKIYNGWCLAFGETEPGTPNYVKGQGYGDDSPLLQAVPIRADESGSFFMTFEKYDHKVFMIIVANLTERENKNFETVNTWAKLLSEHPELAGDPTAILSHDKVVEYRDNDQYNLATFGEYCQQSVGLDGIYNIGYNTTADLCYHSDGITDYSGATTNWHILYENSDANHTSGKNYLTNENETYNGNKPNPASQVNKTTGFPMSSFGFVIDALTEESIENTFGRTIQMIRTCSKVVVDAKDPTFTMEDVYLIGAAQESQMRSIVMNSVTLDDDGNAHSDFSKFSIPKDLGGVIDYEAMPVSGKVSDPIYFYPNSGKDYKYNGGVVNQDVNPQYIIIKGKSSHFDTPGYYKVALKAQYPAVMNPSSDMSSSDWSALTYDILRNIAFTVNLNEISSPGYKTFEDASNPNSPANNISYSITIESSNNRYEVLVSNGTYHVELATSRVYAKGYGTEGISGDGVYVDFTIFPSNGNVIPSTYVQSSDYDNKSTTNNVEILGCKVLREGDAYYSSGANGAAEWNKVTSTLTPETNNTGDGLGGKLVHIKASSKADSLKTTKVRVYYKATNSGLIRLSIGDMQKRIPVVYEKNGIVIEGEKNLTIKDEYNTSWSDFSYNSDSDIEVTVQTDGGATDGRLEKRILQPDGSTISNANNYKNLELHTRVFTSDNSGMAQLYLRQASDFNLWDNVTKTEADKSQKFIYQSTGNIYTYNKTNVSSVANNDARSYTINGAVNSDFSDTGFDQFPSNGWGSSNFSFTPKDIDSNNNIPEINNSEKVVLTNIAGETKSYSFEVLQCALPYINTNKTGVTYDKAKDTYYWTCTTPADCSNKFLAGANNAGQSLGDSPIVYNANYVPASQEDEGSYMWMETVNTGYTNYTGGLTGKDMVDYGISPQHNDLGNNQWSFYGLVKGQKKDGGKYKGDFDLRMTNDAGELIHFVITYLRDDNSQ